MKIQIEIDIFDDPECCDNYLAECEELERLPPDGFSLCGPFRLILKHNKSDYSLKCDECKAAYTKAKQPQRTTKNHGW